MKYSKVVGEIEIVLGSTLKDTLFFLDIKRYRVDFKTSEITEENILVMKSNCEHIKNDRKFFFSVLSEYGEYEYFEETSKRGYIEKYSVYSQDAEILEYKRKLLKKLEEENELEDQMGHNINITLETYAKQALKVRVLEKVIRKIC